MSGPTTTDCGLLGYAAFLVIIAWLCRRMQRRMRISIHFSSY